MDDGGWGGKPIVSEADWRDGSEYGGVGGLIPPIDSAHTNAMTASEQLMLIHNMDPVKTDDLLVEVPKRLA